MPGERTKTAALCSFCDVCKLTQEMGGVLYVEQVSSILYASYKLIFNFLYPPMLMLFTSKPIKPGRCTDYSNVSYWSVIRHFESWKRWINKKRETLHLNYKLNNISYTKLISFILLKAKYCLQNKQRFREHANIYVLT